MHEPVIEISVGDPAWLPALPGLFGQEEGETVAAPLLAEAVALTLAEAEGAPGGAVEIALRLAGDAEVAELNARFRGKTGPTNILSFPADPVDHAAAPGAEQPVHLGDLALARETVFRECEEQGKSASDHVCHLMVHGVLHLLGYDHGDARSARNMEALEKRILARIGVADPYGQDSRRARQP